MQNDARNKYQLRQVPEGYHGRNTKTETENRTDFEIRILQIKFNKLVLDVHSIS